MLLICPKESRNQEGELQIFIGLLISTGGAVIFLLHALFHMYEVIIHSSSIIIESYNKHSVL